MGLFDAISDFFSGGSSNTSSSSYEQEAYGGTNYTGQSPRTPQQKASYATDSSGNYITDSRGNRIETPQSRQNYEDQQAEKRRQQVAAAAEAERLRKLEEARQARISLADRYLGEFLNPAEVDLNILESAGYLDQGGMLYNDQNRAALANYAALNVGQDLASAADVAEYYRQTGDTNISNFDLDQFELLGSSYGKENIGVLDDKMYVINPPSFETAANKVGQMIAGKIAGPLMGGLAGDLAFALGGSDLGAVEGALYADAAGQGVTSFGLSKIFENANILMDASGDYFVNDTLTNPFTGEVTNNIVSVEEKTAQTIAFNEAQQANQSSDDYDTSKVAEIVSNSTGDTINWRDYRGETFSLSPREIVNAAISGVNFDPEVVDAAKFAANLAGGIDPVQSALNVYGDNLTAKLPEGYKKPTEAAVRIGIGGENRVAVFGDIYGKEFNLDNPGGKAGLKSAEVYDMTGDSQQALLKGINTYYKEGGKLPKLTGEGNIFEGINIPFEMPDIGVIEDTIKGFLDNVDTPDLSSIEDFVRSTGSSFEDVVRELGSDAEDLVRAIVPKVNIDSPEIDFGGVKLEDVGLDLADIPDLDISLPDLGKLGFDISFELGSLGVLAASEGTGLPEDEEEFESLEEDEELFDPTRSLAREMLGMEQRREVREAQEKA